MSRHGQIASMSYRREHPGVQEVEDAAVLSGIELAGEVEVAAREERIVVGRQHPRMAVAAAGEIVVALVVRAEPEPPAVDEEGLQQRLVRKDRAAVVVDQPRV